MTARKKPINNYDLREFPSSDGKSIISGSVYNGRLMIKRRLNSGSSVAVNLTPADAHNLGITLCKFLEETRKAEAK